MAAAQRFCARPPSELLPLSIARKGYPKDNIIFDDSHDAVLIQNKQEIMRCGVEDPAIGFVPKSTAARPFAFPAGPAINPHSVSLHAAKNSDTECLIVGRVRAELMRWDLRAGPVDPIGPGDPRQLKL